MQRIAFAVLLALLLPVTHAQPVKCVGKDGKVRYVDAAQAGDECKPVENRLEVAPGAPTAARPKPAAAPPDQSAERIQAAEKRLAEARRQLAEQEATRSGDERNYARMLERLKPYQDAVENAQQELEMARRGDR
jgi:hypothetical protein